VYLGLYSSSFPQKEKLLTMQYVPAKDSAYQWATLFEGMFDKNKRANINEISLENDGVTGIPPNASDLNGQLLVPKDAANVIPPKPEPPSLPELYKNAVPLGDSQRQDQLGRQLQEKQKTKPKKRKKKKVEEPATKKKPKSQKKKTTKRANIVKK